MDIIFKNYFNCEGKANRKEFWLFILNSAVFIFVICFGGLLFIRDFLSYILLELFPYYETLFFLPVIFLSMTIFPLFLACPLINLCIRRLHDIGWNAGILFVIIFTLPLGLILLFFIGVIPGKEEEKQDMEKDKKKKLIINAIIILILLLICYIFSLVTLKSVESLNKAKEEKALIIKDIAESELKYFKQNKDFLYIDKTDTNDILGINIKDSEKFNNFSCVPVTERNKSFVIDKNKESKRVEIQLWNKPDTRDKQSGNQTYVCIILDDDGKQTKLLYRSVNLNSSN